MRVPTAVAIATKIAMAAGDESLRSTLLVLVYLFARGVRLASNRNRRSKAILHVRRPPVKVRHGKAKA
jgi:hypothetical protein